MKLFCLAFCLAPALAGAKISYTLRVDVPAKSIAVTVLADAAPKSVEFRIPAWNPGWYVVTTSYKQISDVKATDRQGRKLGVKANGERGWVVANPRKGPVLVSYRVLGDEGGLGSDRVHVDDRTAFLNGPSAFMYVAGRTSDPTSLKITVPKGWDIATSMGRDSAGAFSARDYDELVDSPIQMGLFKRKPFTVEGVPFEAVYVSRTGDYNSDLDVETERLRKVSAPAMKMFGRASFKKYLYIVHLGVGAFSGGLEHVASTVLDVYNTRKLNLDELAAHEFFHAWNVKQIRPKNLGPFDYSQPCRTKSLWFLEGVTDFYGYLHTYRSGLREESWLLQSFAGEIAGLQQGTARHEISLEDACWQTWEHGGFGYGDLSYYTKGLLVGLILDAAIRDATEGKKTLDDVLRAMYTRYHLPLAGYTDDAIVKTVNEVAGKDLSGLCRTMLGTTEDLPYDRVAAIGLRVRLSGETYKSLGFTVKEGVVVAVATQQAAAGLHAGDKVERVVVGPDSTEVTVLREGASVQLQVPLLSEKARGFYLERDPFASERAQKLLAEWLKR